MSSHYDAFLSYRNKTDYSRARWVESFLESFHKTVEKAGEPVRALQICRDGSDFRLPEKREQQSAEGVWPIIQKELESSEHLLILCSPGTPASHWVSAEIEWFLDHRPDKILLAVTEASNPVEHPEECFPPRIRELGIDKSTIWYDLRGRDRRQRGPGVRDWEDEIVRLASDLLDWDAKEAWTSVERFFNGSNYGRVDVRSPGSAPRPWWFLRWPLWRVGTPLNPPGQHSWPEPMPS